ncbi:peptidyl-prolyl cis-trans isomerase, FKBP-type, partial [mine drainage metagenome]
MASISRRAVEKASVAAKIGETIEKEFAPADAFGERDPKLIELFSMHQISRLPEMRREDAHLDIGTILTIDGRRGRVVSLTQARVRVDFNPPYAGRTLRGKFRVVERIAAPAEQIRALVELQYGRAAEFQVEVQGHVVTLQVPDRTKFDLNWFAAKPRVIDRIRAQVHPTVIRVVEEYVTPAEPAAPAAVPKEPAAAPADTAPAATTGAEPHAAEPKPAKGG